MKILFPTDFSDDAYNALHYTARLYKNEACTFHILHATESVAQTSNVLSTFNQKSYSEEDRDKNLECQLDETVHRIMLDTEKNPKHTFNTSFKKIHLTKAIEDFVDLHPVDLIVMGNKGRKGAKEIFFGNHTLQVVKSIVSCPILCIPRQIDFKPIEHIGFLADYNHSLYGPELEHIQHLASNTKAKLHVVHFCQDAPLDKNQIINKKNLLHLLKNNDPHFHLVPFRGRKASAIRKFVKNQHIDVLAMVYYRHFLLKKLLREPVVMDLSFYLNIPLLIIPDKDL